MYQLLQKICKESVCLIKVFWENLDKISFSPQKIACSYTYALSSF